MIEKYFSGSRDNEVELTVEIKRCLLDFVLKKNEPVFYLIEFNEFELTPKRIFEFTDFDKYCDFAENRHIFRPRLLIEKTEELSGEFLGNEIHADFQLKDQNIEIDVWYVMKLKNAA